MASGGVVSSFASLVFSLKLMSCLSRGEGESSFVVVVVDRFPGVWFGGRGFSTSRICKEETKFRLVGDGGYCT